MPKQIKPKNKGGRPPALKMPEAIAATPEQLAKSIMGSLSRNDSEWKFLKPGGEGYENGVKPIRKSPKRTSRG